MDLNQNSLCLFFKRKLKKKKKKVLLQTLQLPSENNSINSVVIAIFLCPFRYLGYHQPHWLGILIYPTYFLLFPMYLTYMEVYILFLVNFRKKSLISIYLFIYFEKMFYWFKDDYTIVIFFSFSLCFG